MDTENGKREETAGLCEPGTALLSRGASGRLVFRDGATGREVADARVARCFPWSLRGRYISIRDAEGQEICLARDLEEFPAETRAVVEEELAAQEFVPRITAIEDIDDEFDVMTWKVRTDRGLIELQVKDPDDVYRLDDGRVLIKDHAGGVFEVSDPSALDPRSRRLLEQRLP